MSVFVTGKPKPLLSIITVCLNEAKLERTCESIVNQTFQNFEWIVIDGGSNEETLVIFDRYKQRINYFISEKDNGIYDAMNKGIALAKGEWLNFMNAGDCFAEENTLKNILIKLYNNTECDILVGAAKIYPPLNKNLFYLIPPDKITLSYLYAHSLPHQSAFIKKSLFGKSGHYDITYKVISDYRQWIIFYKLGYKYNTSKEIISICDSNGTSSSPQHREFAIIELARLRREYFNDDERKTGIRVRQENFSKVAAFVRKRNNAVTHTL